MSHARHLRKRATKWERVLWRHLRNRNLAGYKFRRQHPVDAYVIDFYCPAVKLGIELDGGGHNYQNGLMHDRARQKILAPRGIEVLRFWNHQIREELDGVLTAIWLALENRVGNNPSPRSSPFGKGRGDSYRSKLT